MCGITGVMNNHAAGEMTKKMLMLLKHRGPDNVGIFEAKCGTAAIGMCQLKVRASRDTTETIPFFISPSTYIAYNGELYLNNVSSGKEEVENLLNNLSELSSTNIMASLAVMSLDGSEMLFGRDLMEIKPLYYTIIDNTSVAFSSELHAFEAIVRIKISRMALDEVMCFGRVVGRNTIYENCFSVKPGLLYKIKKNNEISIENLDKMPTDNKTHTLDSLKRILVSSVKNCTLGNRKIGLAISGGVDSTIIAGILNNLGVKDIITISINVDGSNDYVSDLKQLGLPEGGVWEKWEHHVIDFKAENFKDIFHDAICTYDEPTYMTSVPLYYTLGKEASRLGIVVLLTGEGADELFLGYDSYCNLDMDEIVDSDTYLTKHLLDCKKKEYVCKLLGKNRYLNAISSYRNEYSKTDLSKDKLVRKMEIDFSLSPLLKRTDHCLMRFGVEGRTPFLHNELPKIVEDISYNDLIYEGKGKYLLRKLLKEFVGNKELPKVPFRSPIDVWFAGPLFEWVVEKLNNFTPYYIGLGYNMEFIREIPDMLRNNDKQIMCICFFLLTVGEYFLGMKERGQNEFL